MTYLGTALFTLPGKLHNTSLRNSVEMRVCAWRVGGVYMLVYSLACNCLFIGGFQYQQRPLSPSAFFFFRAFSFILSGPTTNHCLLYQCVDTEAPPQQIEGRLGLTWPIKSMQANPVHCELPQTFHKQDSTLESFPVYVSHGCHPFKRRAALRRFWHLNFSGDLEPALSWQMRMSSKIRRKH